MKYLITGSSGQLGKAFVANFDKSGADYCAPPEEDFDITDPIVVNDVVSNVNPDVLINCAAYNNVEAAEANPETAFRVNAEAVKVLASAAQKVGATIVHYGSDFVFDGNTERPYKEDDPTAPLNEYGNSKLAGEVALSDSGADALLLRVSWVYGDGTQNFFHKILQWTKNKDILKVVWDQISAPTYTEDIVTYTIEALNAGLRGCYHLTNSGYASRYEAARYFFRSLGRNITVIPAGSDFFRYLQSSGVPLPTPASE